MRNSCNGCRVLRKGCSDDCAIRPCLQWIKSADSQANATLFLAKFYGRAGLLNLIEAGPPHLRPAVFRSLLYEACGRIVNPVDGSTGLLWSGKWAHCQAAVDSVMKGSPIMQIPPSSDSPEPHLTAHLQTYDIRHVSKATPSSASELIKPKDRKRTKADCETVGINSAEYGFEPSCYTWLSHQYQVVVDGGGKDDESMFSVETVEGSLANWDEPKTNKMGLKFNNGGEKSEMGLDLTLGLPN